MKKANHIKRGFKKFGGWAVRKIPFMIYDPAKTLIIGVEDMRQSKLVYFQGHPPQVEFDFKG